MWFMRQAGRYMSEYREVRKHHSLVEICKKPKLAAEVTITAAEALDVDAAIIFADLLLPLEVMGLPFHFSAGEGPVIERPLRTDGSLGGHFVTGHIDGIGKIIRWERMGHDHMLDISATRDVMRYVVFKGSIAVDGISLTVAAVQKSGFRIWIIPHTYEVTALRQRKLGGAVNLEADLIGKYVEKFVTNRRREKR